MVVLALVLGMAGCAHPESIKTVSKEQEVLLANFNTALTDIRGRMRTAFGESIQDYKEARLRKWVVTETGSLSTQIVRCRQGTLDCQGKSAKVLLDEAAEYLARGQASLFGDFCSPGGTWESLKTSWMRRKNEQCPATPQEVVRQLEGLGSTLDSTLRKLGEDMGSVQEAHAIIDAFLQVRIEIRQEDVEAAQQTITKATTAVQEAQAAMAEIGEEVAK